MLKVKNKAILSLFILGFCQVQSAPGMLKKIGHIAADAGVAWGFGYQDAIGDPTTYASIRTAEDTNEYTFGALNKKIPFFLLAAITYGIGTGFQYLDYDILGPETGYATGLGLTTVYLSYEQVDMWLKRFVEAQLPWQEFEDESFDLSQSSDCRIKELVDGEFEDIDLEAPRTPRTNSGSVSPNDSPESASTADSRTGLTHNEQLFQKSALRKLREYLSEDSTKRGREVVRFGTMGTIAFIMRHYFGDAIGLVPQIKFAEHISELMEVAPRFKKVPLHVVMRAVEIGTLYGASYGFQALDKYLETIQPAIEGPDGSTNVYWSTNLGAVTAWAAVITLAKSLKLFTQVPAVNVGSDIDLITDAPTDVSQYSDGSEWNGLQGLFDDLDVENGIENTMESMDVEVSVSDYQNESIRPSRFNRWYSGCKQGLSKVGNLAASSGKTIAKHTIRFGALAGASVATSCRELGFVANLRLAEYINELALMLPQPQDLEINLCGKHVTIPVKILKNFAVTGALYGSHYAVALMDEYLLAEYGVTSELATAFIWSSIMNFSDNIAAMIEEDEEEPSIEESDIELARYPEEQ